MIIPEWFISLIALLPPVGAHLFSGYLHAQLNRKWNRRWVSFAGGIAVAYLFLHLIPQLDSGKMHLSFAGEHLPHFVYLLTLGGLILFYGLESLAQHSRSKKEAEHNNTSKQVFWIHIGSFSVYNALIGYLFVHGEHHSTREVLLFSGAMAFHFMVNDYSLRKHHQGRYDRYGRWILSAAICAGWGVAVWRELNHAWIIGFVAFLAGGIFLNVFKEELPDMNHNNVVAFIAGASTYAGLLLLI